MRGDVGDGPDDIEAPAGGGPGDEPLWLSSGVNCTDSTPRRSPLPARVLFPVGCGWVYHADVVAAGGVTAPGTEPSSSNTPQPASPAVRPASTARRVRIGSAIGRVPVSRSDTRKLVRTGEFDLAPVGEDCRLFQNPVEMDGRVGVAADGVVVADGDVDGPPGLLVQQDRPD